jgi:putative ABC transport system permease protein
MGTINQAAAVTAMNVRSIRQRLRPSLVVIVGIAGVVAVLVAMLAMTTGLARLTQSSARADRVIVLSVGAGNEQSSILDPATVAAIGTAPGLATDASGKTLISPEVVLTVTMKDRSARDATIPVRGITPTGFAVHPELEIVEGRAFRAGVREIVVGRAVATQVDGLEVGRAVQIRGTDWSIVGIAAGDGGIHESELIGDADTLNSAIGMAGVQTVVAVLTSADGGADFQKELNPRVVAPVDVKSEAEFYSARTDDLRALFRFVAYTIGGIMALGATFGALTTVSTMVATRSVEIATLRALGFPAVAVVSSVVVEALVLALAGAVVGSAVAWWGFNGLTVSTISDGQRMAFSLAVTPELLGIGAVSAVAMGVLAGLLPAVRAARLPVAMAFRAG